MYLIYFEDGEEPQVKERGWSLEAGQGKKKDPLPEPPERKAAWHSLILAL